MKISLQKPVSETCYWKYNIYKRITGKEKEAYWCINLFLSVASCISCAYATVRIDLLSYKLPTYINLYLPCGQKLAESHMHSNRTCLHLVKKMLWIGTLGLTSIFSVALAYWSWNVLPQCRWIYRTIDWPTPLQVTVAPLYIVIDTRAKCVCWLVYVRYNCYEQKLSRLITKE